jgi:hypothetical protein
MILRSCLILVLGMLGAETSMATSCMVIGEKSARVQSSEGEKSPVFLTQSCEALRLISGKAMVTWVARDGKPNFVPIGANGPEKLPTVGAEERSGNVIWAELTSKREAQRPAFMRALDEERPARIYLPVTGLELPSKAGTTLRILAVNGDSENLVFETQNAESVRLTRELTKPGVTYILEWNQAGKVDKWKWKTLGEQELNRVDAQYQEVQAAVTDEAQRRVVTAMLFEQLKLRVNMGLVLSAGL